MQTKMKKINVCLRIDLIVKQRSMLKEISNKFIGRIRVIDIDPAFFVYKIYFSPNFQWSLSILFLFRFKNFPRD